jgi:hypothetical protein
VDRGKSPRKSPWKSWIAGRGKKKNRGKFSLIVGRGNHREIHRKDGLRAKWAKWSRENSAPTPSIFNLSTGSPVTKGVCSKNPPAAGTFSPRPFVTPKREAREWAETTDETTPILFSLL